MKRIFSEEFVLIDLENNIFKFYNCELEMHSKTNYIMKARYGKLGSGGKFTYKEFKTYKDAYGYYKTKKESLVNEGFLNKEKVVKALSNVNKKINKTTSCSRCKKNLSPEMYEKIKYWSENEGNWKNSNHKELVGNIVCVDCQKELGVFKVPFN